MRTIAIVLSIVLLICEFIYGIPFLGGSIILSFGWQPLIINIILYAVLIVMFAVDSQNTIRPMIVIPIIGAIGTLLAFIPIVGMIVHWVLFFLLIFFTVTLFAAPTYIQNSEAKTIYNEENDHDKQ
ncbi:MAG TPA: hypothetical protein K8V29_01430 [Staphylococcus auricularis]|uniref:Uncharacterized protein n=2 Tax=Staphylococcus auricularis TaxID=29379 RepID=A0AAP8TTF3_9STAP|nr:hypothetical protein [Staphylococcus auricularis]MBM0867298.1 hypothetical protein [Staphylococcus auricularis]MCG7341162.1 hypothetical protein [Staphylococcus auricularis]MDC6327571.1 hypothetical protein [Staphylococcus auricularis]MDN4533523.1 hypothetical protein [Staphylococcus auricularis]MEB6570084.1 hypothetical protein [Staphylococcus auricularis]